MPPPRKAAASWSRGAWSKLIQVAMLLSLVAPLLFLAIRARSFSISSSDRLHFAGNSNAEGGRRLAGIETLFSTEVLNVILENSNLAQTQQQQLVIGPSDAQQGTDPLGVRDVEESGRNSSEEATVDDPENETSGRLVDIHFETQPSERLPLRRDKERAAALTKVDQYELARLESEAIARSKTVSKGIISKHSLWRREDTENSDNLVRLMREQIIMARIFASIAQARNHAKLVQELKLRIRESSSALGEASLDSDLPRSAQEKVRAMGQTLTRARQEHYDVGLVVRKLRAMLQASEDYARSLRKQSSFLNQVAAKTVPQALHCLSLRLNVEYYNLPAESREFPRRQNLQDKSLFHYALFSDNILAASVVVESTIRHAQEPEKHVFHLVTDKLNYGAMRMWFLSNPAGKATIEVQNIDEFTWLNSSYCPVLRQLESAAMKDYYFKPDQATSIASGSSNLKYRNPKYLSMLNHLRFYLPQMYPALDKILFLDDDIVVQKDLTPLWSIDLQGNVNGAVETCGKSFHRYDKYLNFSNPHIARNFDPDACGWAFGMNIFDLELWKKRDMTGIYHRWQSMNEDRTMWKLGTLPPGLITFYNTTFPLDKSWHVLGLGYNQNVDRAEIEAAAVVHYNGNNKPWLDIGLSKYKSIWARYVKYEHPFLQQCNINR